MNLFMYRQGFCPFICINYEYFFEHDIDIQRACEALSNLITELPLLGGRRRGFLMVRLPRGLLVRWLGG